MTEFNAPIEITFANPAGVPSIPAWSQVGTSAAPLWKNMGRLEARPFRPLGPMASTATRRQRRADAPPHLLRPEGRRRPAHAAAPHRRRRRVRRPHAPLDPRHRRERPARQHSALRQWRALPSLRPAPVRDEDGTLHARRQPRLHAGAARRSRKPQPARRGAPGRPAGHRHEPRPGGRRARSRRLRSSAPCASSRSAAVAPGTVVGPTAPRQAALSTKIDLVVSREFIAPQTQLVFSVAGSKTLDPEEADDDRRPGQGSKPATLTAMLSSRGRSGSTPGRYDTSRPAPTS